MFCFGSLLFQFQLIFLIFKVFDMLTVMQHFFHMRNVQANLFIFKKVQLCFSGDD